MHIIAFACCPKVLNHSALGDAELFGDSVGCQSAGRQEHAISLTIAQHSLGPWGCNTGNALCCRQRHGADAFCHGEEINRKPRARANRECARSEERRLGKEGGRTGRSWWAPDT